ncbi:carbon storage regulator CsrA [Paenibacillus sp. GSMTC-2017]|uniref:carbon storage regulator CsrA n=1 Tax=Paenibacillus sp. GSMTC-2017 TaxID=2794350 RepID=UPI0018D76A7F|nr:carbon storage regulator CsrA [Paenibacillus sp. GSMTC-2017]MBH5320622.1 carbon storage regulator CsrA [Paenibacillus sp. GSMTC-2017]
MLVLSRKIDESIMIGNDVEIIVLGVEGDNVKLGIRAPKDVSIYRKEIYTTIQEENRAAASRTISLEDVAKLFGK